MSENNHFTSYTFFGEEFQTPLRLSMWSAMEAGARGSISQMSPLLICALSLCVLSSYGISFPEVFLVSFEFLTDDDLRHCTSHLAGVSPQTGRSCSWATESLYLEWHSFPYHMMLIKTVTGPTLTQWTPLINGLKSHFHKSMRFGSCSVGIFRECNPPSVTGHKV